LNESTTASANNNALAVFVPQFTLPTSQIKAQLEQKREILKIMKQGEHYDKPKGMENNPNAKMVLLKSGAEFLISNMGMSTALLDAETPICDYDGSLTGGVPLIKYRKTCKVFRIYPVARPSGMEFAHLLIAEADGLCSSREVKYRYRDAVRRCPTCAVEAIIKGKEEYGGGWICYGKKGGCGDKFKDDDGRITDQKIGRVENPDIGDLENTILKMAGKRALVAGVLIATGCSDLFTQDIEEDDHGMHNVTPPEERARQQQQQGGATKQQTAAASSAASQGQQSRPAAAKADPKDKINQKQMQYIEEHSPLWQGMNARDRAALVATVSGGRTNKFDELKSVESRPMFEALEKKQAEIDAQAPKSKPAPTPAPAGAQAPASASTGQEKQPEAAAEQEEDVQGLLDEAAEELRQGSGLPDGEESKAAQHAQIQRMLGTRGINASFVEATCKEASWGRTTDYVQLSYMEAEEVLSRLRERAEEAA
jgi:hypothetical protein